ncbi:MAG TPA: L-2-hydroxyglutarate oxidase [Capsulimonadaceae bacterium]
MGESSSTVYDVIVIGGGIVGLATAREIMKRRPTARLAVLEKEPEVAAHQTGHNSGVVHAGIYYKPGSLKAQLCVAGARRMAAYAQLNNVRYEQCGKLIVAATEEELPVLDTLLSRATANGVPGVKRIDKDRLSDFEPNVAGVGGLWSPSTAIIDFAGIAKAFAADINKAEGQVLTSRTVREIRRDGSVTVIVTNRGEYKTRSLVNCAGLHSDRIALMCGIEPNVRIVPFRGEYYHITPGRAHLVRGLIYPVPDPRFPFLGVHFTKSVDGSIEAGPNAVLALAREGYLKSDINLADAIGTLCWPGFVKLAMRYWKMGLDEMHRSASKARFAASLQRLVPEIGAEDLVSGGAGVRAQAVARDGSMLDDFLVVPKGLDIHVLNVPSPAATASLSIAEHLVDLMPSD